MTGVLLASGCSAGMPGTAPAPPVTGPAATGELTQEDVDAWLDGLLPASLEQSGIAGATVSVVHDGELLTARGYGRSDTGVGYEYHETASADIVAEPVDPDMNLFRVGSLSKPVTATAVMQLVEAGEVDLDTDVGEYVDVPVPSSFDTDVTLRHLLTHTGGFEERFGRMFLPWGTEPNLRDFLATDPPEQIYTPGTVPAYSNYGSALAGYVVEQVSGQPFEDYVQEHVLAPIGMDSSTFHQPLPEATSFSERSMSQAYVDDDSRPEVFEIVGGAPAGALTSSATDMARFMLAHLGETDQALLDPETLDLMHRPALDEDTLGALAQAPRATLGFFEQDRNGHRIIGHTGDTQFFHSHLQLYPDEGTGIFVSLNSSGYGDDSYGGVREAVTSGFADRYFPAEEEDSPPLSTTTSTGAEHAALAEGTYNSSRSVHSNFLAVVAPLDRTRVEARSDGTLVVSPEPETGAPVAYEEIEPWVWQEIEGQRLITMRVTDGEVREIGFGSAFTLERTDPGRTASVVLPVLAVSLLVLAVGLVAQPVAALVRRSRGAQARGRAARTVQVLTWIASAAAVGAIVAWTGIVLTVTGLQDVSPVVIRLTQAVQVLAVLGVLPAALSLFQSLRHRAGWWRGLGAGLVLAALIGVAWFALTFGLLLPDISY